MAERLGIAVIGAGPFGLSVAAHLPERSRLFGPALETWRARMPPGMRLRSAWEETSLSAHGGHGTIDEWAAATGAVRSEPLVLETFTTYGDWFLERFVREHDPAEIVAVEDAGRTLRVTTATGDEADVEAVVVAVGIVPFAYAPPPFDGPLEEGVGFALAETAPAELAGRPGAVVGGGQGALEAAARAFSAGADVELIARAPLRWFADREPHRPRGPLRRRAYRLAYPAVGYGPPPLNRLALHPDLFAALPGRLRERLTRRLLRSGGSPWLRDVLAPVRIREGVGVTGVERAGPGLRLSLGDGSVEVVDRVLLATGFRFDLRRLDFLAPELRAGVDVAGTWPVLDRSFRSTDPRIFFVGFAAEGRFGPLSRFVLGAGFAAGRVAGALG